MREVPVLRDRVEMAPYENTLGAPETRSGDDGVPVTLDLQVRQGAQSVLDGGRENRLVARLAGDVDERGGEGDGPREEVEGRGFGHVATVAA